MYRLIHSFFFFNDTATTEIYTLSLHDALPISTKLVDAFIVEDPVPVQLNYAVAYVRFVNAISNANPMTLRSEEHTSELQSQSNLVCRLLLEKKKSQTSRGDNETN